MHPRPTGGDHWRPRRFLTLSFAMSAASIALVGSKEQSERRESNGGLSLDIQGAAVYATQLPQGTSSADWSKLPCPVPAPAR